MRSLSLFIFWLLGWKAVGEMPPLKKFVIIMAPHTSAWDTFYGLCGRYIFRIKFSFFGKKELFGFPFGFIFRAYGGIPVDRSSSSNVVDQAVKMFNEREHFMLALSPEGTRAYVPKWRTGFYHIAVNAKVPIVLTYIDFAKKVVGIGPTFYPTGDIDRDLETIRQFYLPIKGKHPEKGVR